MTHLNPPNPARKPRHGLTIRAYIGTCLACRQGCYQGDETVRGRGQWLGLLHAWCATKTGQTEE